MGASWHPAARPRPTGGPTIRDAVVLFDNEKGSPNGVSFLMPEKTAQPRSLSPKRVPWSPFNSGFGAYRLHA